MNNKKINNKKSSKNDFEVVTGDGKNLNISEVTDHIKFDDNSYKTKDKNRKIIIPKNKK